MAKVRAFPKKQEKKGKRAPKKGVAGRGLQYLKDVRYELDKVSWPGRAEIVTSTVVVVATVLFFAIVIGILDGVFVFLVNMFSQGVR